MIYDDSICPTIGVILSHAETLRLVNLYSRIPLYSTSPIFALIDEWGYRCAIYGLPSYPAMDLQAVIRHSFEMFR